MGKRTLQTADAVRQQMGALYAVSFVAKAVDIHNNKRTWEQVTRTSDEQLKIETHQSIGCFILIFPFVLLAIFVLTM
jgi:hypothetical protein